MQTCGMTKNQPQHSEPATPTSQTFSPMPSGMRDASAASGDWDATMVQASHNATSTSVDPDALAHLHDQEGPALLQAKGTTNEKRAEPNKKILPSAPLQTLANRSLINPADLNTLTKINFCPHDNNADSPEEDSASATPFTIVTTNLENAVLTLSSTDDNQNPNPFTHQQLHVSQLMPDRSPSQT
jgi:hypothetical protein